MSDLKKIKDMISGFMRIFSQNAQYSRKNYINAGCSAKFSVETEQKLKEIDEELRNIIKKYFNSPDKLLEYMESEGMKIFRIKNAEKVMTKIGEEEGFIIPLKGFSALLLNSVLLKKIVFKFSSDPVFIFDVVTPEIYTIITALYKYYGFKKNLPGYDYNSQRLFKKVRKNQSLHKRLSIKELSACKEALSRDMESVNFTIKISAEYAGSKNALKKIKSSDSAIL